MTMTDDELDTLLRATGDVLDERSAAHARPLDRSPGRRSRRHVAGLAAAGLVAAAVAALIVVANVRNNTDDGHITPATTPAPSSTDLDPATFAGVQVCAEALAGYSAPPEQFREYPLPDAATAEILLLDIPGRPTRVRVLMVGNGATYACSVERDVGTDGRIVSGALSLGTQDEEPPAGGVILDDLQIGGGRENGPGSFIAIGRADSQVVSVSVDLPDGTSYPGVVTSGRFVVEGFIPTGVPLFEQRVSWTLASGEVRSDRADLLDAPSDVEECAADPICVETRILELQRLAVDWPEQAAALVDGDVTAQEHAAANERFVACLVDAGIDAEVFGNGYAVTDGPTEQDQPAMIGCGGQHLDLVGELFKLQDAQRRIADG